MYTDSTEPFPAGSKTLSAVQNLIICTKTRIGKKGGHGEFDYINWAKGSVVEYKVVCPE
jgi:hypothetical protein